MKGSCSNGQWVIFQRKSIISPSHAGGATTADLYGLVQKSLLSSVIRLCREGGHGG